MAKPRYITYAGETLSIRQWSKKTGIDYNTLVSRLLRWDSVEKALTPPKPQVHRANRTAHDTTVQGKKKINQKQCMTCHNRNFTARSQTQGSVYCEYMYWHGHRRPCKAYPVCMAYEKGPFRQLPKQRLHERGWGT